MRETNKQINKCFRSYRRETLLKHNSIYSQANLLTKCNHPLQFLTLITFTMKNALDFNKFLLSAFAILIVFVGLYPKMKVGCSIA